MTDKLVTTLKELPVLKRSRVLDNIKSRLDIGNAQPTKRTLTSNTHKWLLPQGNLQRVPIVAHPEQRVKQRVTPIHHADAAPLQHITEAPPIMAAPNPTVRRTLKMTKQTHSRQMRNNILGGVPEITRSPSARCPLPAPVPAAMQTSPMLRQLPRTHKQSNPQMPVRIPKIHFRPIPGGIHNSNVISQKAINFLTKCVWAKSPNIFTPKKWMPTSTPTCLDYEQVAMPMVHPITGKTISSYNRLMKDPNTAETWQMAFSKDFGGMAQGNQKTGQKGTNSIFVMTHNEISCIPKGQTITYAPVVVDFFPQKLDPHCI